MDFPKPEMLETNGIELEVYQAGVGGVPIVLRSLRWLDY